MVNTNPIITGKHNPTMSGKHRPAIDTLKYQAYTPGCLGTRLGLRKTSSRDQSRFGWSKLSISLDMLLFYY
jgi:hypothetical protein